MDHSFEQIMERNQLIIVQEVILVFYSYICRRLNINVYSMPMSTLSMPINQNLLPSTCYRKAL